MNQSLLLEPGWAGDLSQGELGRNRRTRTRWEFAPKAKRFPEKRVRQVAKIGDPNQERGNAALARSKLAQSGDSRGRFPS